MKKSILYLLICLMLAVAAPVYAAEISQKSVYFNDEPVEFKNSPFEESGCMIVPIRELSEMAGFQVKWDGEKRKVVAHNERISVTMYIGDTRVRVLTMTGRDKDVESILPPEIINSVTYIPLRVVSEAFGAEVKWDAETNTVYIYLGEKTEEQTTEEEDAVIAEPEEPVTAQEKVNTFYSQYDSEYIEQYAEEPYHWTSGRNGYCYVTSYAMLLSDVTGVAVTPKDVADINLEKCGNASMCYHGDIVGKYNCRLVQAIPSDSPYFKEYDAGRGMTMIDNSTPESVIAAIKTALDAHPEGVMVRDASMPHTMVAIGYEGDEIYFNDPALTEGGAKWSETCLKNKEITTISGIAAIENRK